MAAIDNLLKDAGTQIEKLAAQLFTNFKDQAVTDGQDFLQRARNDLNDWTHALEAGQMTKDEFTSLVKGESDLAEMRALKQAGLAQIDIDTFTNGVINIVINAAFSALKI
jgi:hypothetical protein